MHSNKKNIYPSYASCMCVGCVHSPQSLTSVSSWGFPRLPRDSVCGLTSTRPAQALFKTVNRFEQQLERFRV